MLRFLKSLLLVLIALIFVTFAVANRHSVNISLFPLPYEAELPGFLLAIGCFVLGAVTAWLVMSLKLAQSHWKLSAERRRAAALENEVKGLKMEQHVPASVARIQRG